MRNRRLHDALRDFALEAAALLTADVQAGAELSFDVDETGGRRSVLYSYRPLTAEFIAPRWERLRTLAAFEPAAAALGSGAAAYLRVRGVGGDDAEPALHALLDRLYEDATGFEFPEERYERVYAEVEGTLYEHAIRMSVITPLRGLRMDSDRVELGGGLALVRGDWTEAPPEAVWPEFGPPQGAEALPNVLCVLDEDAEGDGELPLAEAAARFAALCTALRLFKPGGVAPGPAGWARADTGPWRSFPLAVPTDPRAPEWRLSRGEEDELREFLAVVARSTHAGAVAWALDRFEMGCERADATEGLSDHLLALGALLGANDEGGRGSLSLRLAALCAEEQGRRSVQRRVELAFALERWAIAGGAGPAYIDVIGSEPPASIAAEIEHHLRALLRDILCGYLEPDLRAVADDILLAASEPFEIGARDLSREAARPRQEPLPELQADPDPDYGPEPDYEREPLPDPEPVPVAAPAVAPPRSQLATSPPAGAPPEPAGAITVRRLDGRPGEVPSERDERAEPDEGELEPTTTEFAAVSRQASFDIDMDPGVTASTDWDFDDDPDSFSAPI
ncbi:MAG: hypothetical protein WD844_12995 [Thermoleophilaceae bacterium]